MAASEETLTESFERALRFCIGTTGQTYELPALGTLSDKRDVSEALCAFGLRELFEYQRVDGDVKAVLANLQPMNFALCHASASPFGPGTLALARTGTGRLRMLFFSDVPRGTLHAMRKKRHLMHWLRQAIIDKIDYLSPRFPLQAIKTPKTSGITPLRRLMAMVKLERPGLYIVLLYALFNGILTLVAPITVQALVTTIALSSLVQPLIVLALLLFAALSLQAFLQATKALAVELLERRLFVRVAEDFGHRLPRMAPDMGRKVDMRELTNRFFEVVSMQKAMSTVLLDTLGLFLQTIVGLILLGFYHPVLLAFDAILVIALIIIVVPFARGALGTALAESSAKYKMAAWLEILAESPNIFRTQAARAAANARTEGLATLYLAKRSAHFRILFRQIIGGLALQVFALASLLAVGGWLVMADQLTLGQLVAAELVVSTLGYGFAKLGSSLGKVYDLAVGATKLSVVVDVPLERRTPGEVTKLSASTLYLPLAGGTTTALNHGANVAVHGGPGSGKSFFLRTLAGLEPANEKGYRVGETPLVTISREALAELATLIDSDPLFPGTLRENLAFGREPSTLRRVLDRVGLGDTEAKLPDGLNTQITHTGFPLSDVEVARVKIARAMLSGSTWILVDRVLDEAYDHGDPALKRVLDESIEGPSFIVVTDREDVAECCSRSILLKNRKIEVQR